MSERHDPGFVVEGAFEYFGGVDELAEALLDGLPRPVQGLRDLRPGSALRTSLLDRNTLKLWQNLSQLRKRVEDHEWFVA